MSEVLGESEWVLCSLNGTVEESSLIYASRGLVDRVNTPFEQLIPCALISSGDRYLSYSRKGSEPGLLGKKSLLIGGHVSLEDKASCLRGDVWSVFTLALRRELREELGLESSLDFSSSDLEFLVLKTHSSEVDERHKGFMIQVELTPEEKESLSFSEEIFKPEWLTLEEIEADLASYESWGQELFYSWFIKDHYEDTLSEESDE